MGPEQDEASWNDVPGLPEINVPAAATVVSTTGDLNASQDAAAIRLAPLPADPLARYSYELRVRPDADHWPAPVQGKLRLSSAAKVFYGTSVASVLDQMRRQVE